MDFSQYQHSDETVLSPEEKDSLLIKIETRSELNLAEAINILDAFRFCENKSFELEELLDDVFVRDLHRRMFSDVWSWAGKYRTRDLNIGIRFESVSTHLHDLMEDSKYWLNSLDNEQLISSSCQIHHRIVSIHPFYNGNGRLARLFTDLINRALKIHEFNWSSSNLEVAGKTRTQYIDALRSADQGNLDQLISFVSRKK